jgi:hypothetical protein
MRNKLIKSITWARFANHLKGSMSGERHDQLMLAYEASSLSMQYSQHLLISDTIISFTAVACGVFKR